MNLKRNDKIILIVGVVILIVAGAGIALYNAPSSENDGIDATDSDDMYYDYSWMQNTGSETIESPMVDKNTPFEQAYTINGPSGCVLTQVTVNIDWIDDNTFGLLRTKGQDTLTAEVSLNGKSLEETSEMEGNHSFAFNVNSMPRDGSINGSSASDVASKLKEEYKDKNSADFDVLITIETGEPWWRFLLNRDNGNEVDISVEYTYYTHELTEVDDNDDDTKSTGDDDIIVSSHALGEFYVNLGYGRGMI
jgi:hypothetical protein